MPHDYWLILALEMIKIRHRLIESCHHWMRAHRKSPSLGGGIIESLRHWGEGSSKVSVIGGGDHRKSPSFGTQTTLTFDDPSTF